MPRPIILVHGYAFDPGKPGKYNPNETIFPQWKAALPESREIIPFSYYSAGGPSKFRTTMRAWSNGYRDPYRWAYSKLAVDAAKKLAERCSSGSYDVVCHSLGTRVVLLAQSMGAKLNRIVMMGGAEMVPIARRAVLLHPATQYLNVMSFTDDILDLMAEHFTPGDYLSAIGCDGIPSIRNLRNVVLDDPEVQDWAKAQYGWNLNGDLDEWMDHHVYYQWAGNWPMYLAFLDGDDLTDLPDKAKGENNDFFD